MPDSFVLRTGVAVLLAAFVTLALTACGEEVATPEASDPWEAARAESGRPPIPWQPQTYLCRPATAGEISLDGKLDEAAWTEVPWSRDFIDIVGASRPTPRLRTHVKLLWDAEFLYVAAELEEPHLQASFTERDSYIYQADNDFEVFLDPNADTHDYFELEMNALGTEWDLLLRTPYRDWDEHVRLHGLSDAEKAEGPAIHTWDMEGLRTAVHLDGTLNDPSDTDRGWTIEIAIPWSALAAKAGTTCPPEPGDQWRLNFSRVEWTFDAKDGAYVKRVDPATGESFHEDNWVWSEQGLVAMHYPERWGVLEFAGPGTRPLARVELAEADLARDRLRELYYLQQGWKATQGQFFVSGTSPGWPEGGEPGAFRSAWGFEGTPHTYVSWIRLTDGRTLALRPDGKVAYFDPPVRRSALALLDWAILALVFAVLVGGVVLTKKYMRSVADFLAAGRTGGRYLLSVSQGMAALGAITIVANLQMNFEAGFTMSWWGLSMGLIVTILAVSGWVIYRFRATRSFTLAEFFERRYSRRFRVFAGLVAFGAGLINFGIFPAVGARFFIHFVGLPESFDFLGTGLEVGTYPLVMAFLLLTALYFVFAGGQVAVMVTDFLQGLFSNVVFLIIPLYLLFVVDWSNVVEVLVNRPPGRVADQPLRHRLRGGLQLLVLPDRRHRRDLRRDVVAGYAGVQHLRQERARGEDGRRALDVARDPAGAPDAPGADPRRDRDEPRDVQRHGDVRHERSGRCGRRGGSLPGPHAARAHAPPARGPDRDVLRP